MTNLQAIQTLHHIARNVLAVSQGLDILELENGTMAIDPTVQNVISALDAATTAVATRIQNIIDNPPNSTADLVAALQPEVDKLNGLGTQPTPVEVITTAQAAV